MKMWVRAMLWLGASRQIAVINVIKMEAKSKNRPQRVFGTFCLMPLPVGQGTYPPCLEHVWLFVWLLQESRQITCKG